MSLLLLFGGQPQSSGPLHVSPTTPETVVRTRTVDGNAGKLRAVAALVALGLVGAGASVSLDARADAGSHAGAERLASATQLGRADGASAATAEAVVPPAPITTSPSALDVGYRTGLFPSDRPAKALSAFAAAPPTSSLSLDGRADGTSYGSAEAAQLVTGTTYTTQTVVEVAYRAQYARQSTAGPAYAAWLAAPPVPPPVLVLVGADPHSWPLPVRYDPVPYGARAMAAFTVLQGGAVIVRDGWAAGTSSARADRQAQYVTDARADGTSAAHAPRVATGAQSGSAHGTSYAAASTAAGVSLDGRADATSSALAERLAVAVQAGRADGTAVADAERLQLVAVVLDGHAGATSVGYAVRLVLRALDGWADGTSVAQAQAGPGVIPPRIIVKPPRRPRLKADADRSVTITGSSRTTKV
jgi:hypothetical protein